MIYTILSLGLIVTLSIAWIFISKKLYKPLSRWLLFPLTGGIIWTLSWLSIHIIYLYNVDILSNHFVYGLVIRLILLSIVSVPIGLIIASIYYPINTNHIKLKTIISFVLTFLYIIFASFILFVPKLTDFIVFDQSLFTPYSTLFKPKYQIILFLLLLTSLGILFKRLNYISNSKTKLLGLYFVLGYFFTIIGYLFGHLILYLQFNISIVKYSPISLIIWIIFILFGAIKYKIIDAKIFIPQLVIIWTIIIIAVIAFNNRSFIVFILDLLFLFLFSILGFILIKNLHHADQLKIKLHKENKKMKKFIDLKDNFLRMTTHQLRTPIIIVEEYTKNILNHQKLNSKQNSVARDYINKLLLNNYKLKYIIEDLSLAYAINSNNFKLRSTTKIDLEQLLSNVINDVNISNNYSNIQLSFKKTGHYKYIINGEVYYLYLAFKKIIENTYMFAKQNVNINMSYYGKRIFISILDDGIGLSKSDLNQLFLPFARGKRASYLYPDGSGISLYLVKHIIEKHKGKIKLVSKGEELGTETIIYFDKL